MAKRASEGQAPDPGVDLVKLGDAFQPVFGDGRGAVAGDFKEFAAGVGPAIGKPDGGSSPVGLDQAVVPGIAVRRANSPPDCLLTLLTLQDAGEALQNGVGILLGSRPGAEVKATPGGAAPPQGRSSRASARKYPVPRHGA